MDKREFNRRLNGLKDAYPSELALIEGIQDLFNKKIEVISSSNARALLGNPWQFTKPVNTAHGEWTTHLHIWADNMVEQLLSLDPLVLETKDSMGNTVLHEMVFAATGKFTQMINYDYIAKMLDKNMSYMYLTVPNVPESKTEGNVWMSTDPSGKTPMDYLVDMANGDDGMPDERLAEMLMEFSMEPDAEAPVDSTPSVPITDDEAKGIADDMTMDCDGDGPEDEAELTSMDRATSMAPDPSDPDGDGTPVQEKALDNQDRQIDQAQEELKQQPNPMLETLLTLFH